MDRGKNVETQVNDDEDPPALEEYLDFELEIGAGSGRSYPVAVVRSTAGEAREVMQFPFDDLTLDNQLLTLQNALLRSGGKPRHILLPEEQSVQDFGLALFSALFSGSVGNCYAVSLREAGQQGKGLRVKLRILSPEMAAIPWEFLYDPGRGEYICLSRNTPVVRYLELPQPPQPLPVTLPLRILGMIATPINLPPLDVQREQQRIEKALEPLQQRGQVQLTWLSGQTWRDVQQAMREGPWHIFHFIGHGSFDSLADEGLIALADDQGQADLFRATQLARLLSDHRSLRLVVLNACESAKSGRHDVFSSAAANLVRHGIPAVLAMQYTITDAAAIVFSRAFYETLAEDMPIDAAVSEARKAVCFDVENTLEWGIPVLFMRSPDGVLFTVGQGPTFPALTPAHRSELTGGTHYEDWGEAPSVDQFQGRETERAELRRWLIDARCQIVALTGMGGIGKTSLAAYLAGQIKLEFDYVYWRSLQNAPTFKNILKNCVKFLSRQQQVELPEDLDGQITLLIQYLRDHRCLIVFDNFETVLQAGTRAGQYREGYEGYGKLLQRVGEAKHQSCLVLTSREKPKEIALIEGVAAPVRSYRLEGLTSIDGREILKAKGLQGEETIVEALTKLYAGNPLALKLVSQFIREVFGGNIASFLETGEAIFSDISDVLYQQFSRLSTLEREAMYWLAIDREAVSLDELGENLVHCASKRQLLEALESLRQRSMIETSNAAQFTQQPVIMEYVTNNLVQRIFEEVSTGTIDLLINHSLMNAQAKDYVRVSQVRCVLIPIAERLLAAYGKAESEKKLKNILAVLHEAPPQVPGYAAGNVLNLLVQIQCDLQGLDFSHLTVWQACLQDVALPDVDFTGADLSKSAFTETFGSILAVAFSPDNTLLAAATADGDIRLWEAMSGRPLMTNHGHKDWVWSIAFSPNGQILASGGEDQTIRLWEVSAGREIRVLQGHRGWIRSIVFSPDGQLLASAGEDRKIRLWQVSTGQLLNSMEGYPGWIRSIAFSPDGHLLASGGEDQSVWLWQVSTCTCLRTLQSHTIKVRSLAFSPDGKLLVGGGLVPGDEENVCFWEVATGRERALLKGPNKPTWSVAFSPDGKFLATSNDDHAVRMWDMSSGECLYTLQGHRNTIRSVSFSPGGQLLASGCEDGTVRVWDSSTGKCQKALRGHSRSTWSIAFSPDGNMMASGDEDHAVRLWDVHSGRVRNKLQGHVFRVGSVIFSPDGRLLASGSEDQTVRVWDSSTGSCLKTLQGHTHKVRSVSFSFDSNMLASGAEDRSVRLWDVRTGRELRCLSGHTNVVWTVAFSTTKYVVASGGADQTVRLWDANTGWELNVLRGHTGSVWSTAFNPKGDLLASAGADLTVRLWDANTGQYLKTLQGHTHRVRSIAFSPDGKLLASGGEDQTVRVWEVRSGKCLTLLNCSPYQLRSIAFHPTGKFLAISTSEGPIEFFETATGNYLKTLLSDRPYEHMNITGVRGLTEVQIVTLKALGAVENEKNAE